MHRLPSAHQVIAVFLSFYTQEGVQLITRELLGGERKEQSLWDVTWGYYALIMLSIGFELPWDKLSEEVIPNRIISMGLMKGHPISVFLGGKKTPGI